MPGEFDASSIGVMGGGFSNGKGISITSSGYTANAVSIGDIAIGGVSSANSGADGNNNYAVAIGDTAKANASQSVALGNRANASGGGDIAIGSKAFTSNNDAIAIGNAANATANDALAIGSQVSVGAVNAIALGSNYVTVDSGSTGSFVVAPSNNGGVSGSSNAVAILGQATNAASAVAIGNGSRTSSGSATAIGAGANAAASSALALGNNASALGSDSVSLGRAAQAIGNNTIVIGYNAKSNTGAAANGTGNIAVGSNAVVNNVGAGAIAIGRSAKIDTNSNVPGATGAGSIALGDGAAAYGDASTAIGGSSYAGQSDSLALGNGARVLSPGSSIALGANTLADEVGTVSIGNKSTGLRHRLVNMDQGLGSYDAVNVSQLQPVVTALGGGASIDPATGTVAGPTYTLVNGGVQTTLSGALNALDQAVSDGAGWADAKYFAIHPLPGLAAEVGPDSTGSLAIGSAAYAIANGAVAIGTNSIATDPNTFSVGSPGAQRKVVFVAPGDISASSLDAVNGAQLYATEQQLSELQDALNGSGLIDPGTGATLAVTYSSALKDTIVLGSAGRPVEIMNVAAAIAPNDAVNLTQLTSTADALRSEFTGNLRYVKVNSDGADANAAALDAVAIGSASLATIEGSLAVGVRTRASAAHAVAIGSDSLADVPLTVSLGNKPAGLTRRLVNLQAGADINDAVNVSQLQPVITALGGGASIDPVTGAVTGPTYTLANGGAQSSLDGALSALDQAISDSAGNNPYLAINSIGSDAAATGNDAIGLGSGAIASGNNAVALGANAVADLPNTVSVGTAGSERKIVNVAAGDLSATSTDAVNGAQLYASDQQLSALQDALNGSGLIDPGTGASLAVTYSSASKNTILLGNLGTPVEIMNVSTGLADTDAVNVAQMTGAVNGLRSELSNNLAYVKVNATGVGANAGGSDSVAIGSSANTTAVYGVAIGTYGLARLGSLFRGAGAELRGQSRTHGIGG